MKNYHILLFSLCLLLSACATLTPTYFGDKLPPTSSVETFYSEHDVKQPYKVIGHLTIPNLESQDSIKSKLARYGKSIGADAIVISGNTVNSGKYTSDVVNADALKYTKE